MTFFDIGESTTQLITILTVIGMSMGLLLQIRSIRKDQKEQAEKNRAAITAEINEKTTTLFERIEGRLEAIKIAAIVTKDDITLMKTQLTDLRHYVDNLDKAGTIEWQKTKPFIIEKIQSLEERIDEIEHRYTAKFG